MVSWSASDSNDEAKQSKAGAKAVSSSAAIPRCWQGLAGQWTEAEGVRELTERETDAQRLSEGGQRGSAHRVGRRIARWPKVWAGDISDWPLGKGRF